jgi:tetratricopeptide (TPR) repeat protein
MAIDVREVSLLESAHGEAAAKTTTKAPPRVWLYTPAIDLLVGCAGWTAPLLLFLYFLPGSSAALSIAFYGLALLFNYPHYTATIYRAYRTREDFSRYRLFTIHLTLLMVLSGAIAHWSGWLVPWIFTIYITWSPWHYSGQNFGLALMFARRADVRPTRIERTALFTSFLASYGIVLLTMQTGVSMDPYVLSIGIPVGVGEICRAVLAVVFVLTGPWALFRLAKRGGWRLIVGPTTLFATQFLWFVLPLGLQLAYHIDIPQTRYSTGILAVMHSAQYLWFTSYYARREEIASGADRWRARSYFAILILGGIALFVPGPWLISYVFRYDFTASFLIFTAIVNIHHFLLDGAIWKLREGRIGSLLISSPAKVTSSLWGLASWIASPRSSARALRIGAVALLLLVAALDQTRFFLTAEAGDTSRLSRAERLNPYDSSVHDSLARAGEDSGDVDKALAEFKRAVQLNPYNPEVRNAYFKLLLRHNRYQEAYDEYEQLTPYIKGDWTSLLNFGILAERLGHRDEAVASWRRTLIISPKAKSAYLYLADALYADGKRQEAIPYYEQYLTLLTSTYDSSLDPQDVVVVALRLGDAYAAEKDYQRALVFCEKASNIARQSQSKSLESLALEHEGNIYAAVGQRADAAQFYQGAIRLDYEGNDQKAAGLDWFGYAEFLNDSGQPKTLVMAVVLKAESALAAYPGKELDLVKQYKTKIEQELGPGVAQQVGHDQETFLQQAVKAKL